MKQPNVARVIIKKAKNELRSENTSQSMETRKLKVSKIRKKKFNLMKNQKMTKILTIFIKLLCISTTYKMLKVPQTRRRLNKTISFIFQMSVMQSLKSVFLIDQISIKMNLQAIKPQHVVKIRFAILAGVPNTDSLKSKPATTRVSCVRSSSAIVYYTYKLAQKRIKSARNHLNCNKK